MNTQPVIETGAVLEIPLNKLKKSPRNARKTPHGEAAIEALAASIAAKGLLQAPVVEPELVEGEPVFRLAKVTPISGISASKNDPLSLRL